MKKKGFTLIELLAVILILGIIALIAIPTVNKILTEAREGDLDGNKTGKSFETGTISHNYGNFNVTK